MQIWNDFLFGIVFFGVDLMLIMVVLNNFVNMLMGVKEYNVDMVGVIIVVLLMLFVYIVVGCYFVCGLMVGVVKG